MKLIVGLGNYGPEYEQTPHNAGFMFVDEIALLLGGTEWKYDKYANSDTSYIVHNEKKIMLVKPRTFMNLSGKAVGSIMNKKDIELRDLILAYDDLDIALGESKVCVGKQPPDHKGVASVVANIGRAEYLNVRIGVESRIDRSKIPGEMFVVRKMSEENYQILQETVNTLAKRVIEDHIQL